MCCRAAMGAVPRESGWSILQGLPQEFGDEPLLIARKLQVPVIVGEDRYEAGRFAEARFGPQFHLLDDGFQHRALARDFDIVLVTPQDAARPVCCPAGRLREPLHSLQRADAVVLASGASADSFPIEGKLVWRVRRGIVPVERSNSARRVLRHCPSAEFCSATSSGKHRTRRQAFYRDHHAYS